MSGQWIVPAATQHKHGEAEFSASWLGIGGGCVTDNCSVTDNTLIQAGTEQDVTKAGKTSYGAWWEIIPEPQTTVSLPVRPGNKIKVTAGLDVHQDRAVDMPFAEREVIDAEHQRSPAPGVGCGADQPQQRRPTG
jgi:hypothetical protein